MARRTVRLRRTVFRLRSTGQFRSSAYASRFPRQVRRSVFVYAVPVEAFRRPRVPAGKRGGRFLKAATAATIEKKRITRTDIISLARKYPDLQSYLEDRKISRKKRNEARRRFEKGIRALAKRLRRRRR